MVSVFSLGQPDSALAAANLQDSSKLFAPKGKLCLTSDRFECLLGKSESAPENASIPSSHQWPWRSFAFSSDLGTLGYLINNNKLGIIGWALALPYYAYSVFSQPKGPKRNEELLYQTTANGVLPFAEAKAGIMAGKFFYHRFSGLLEKKYPVSGLNRLTQPMYKMMGGIASVLLLTPLLGDPLSEWVLKKYRFYQGKAVTL